MPSIALNLVGDGDADGVWPDLADKTVHHVTSPIGIGALRGGMQSGAPSVAMRLELDDGSVVLAETSLVLFLSAADALRARFGDPRR
jgi:hypothetical protein